MLTLLAVATPAMRNAGIILLILGIVLALVFPQARQIGILAAIAGLILIVLAYVDV